MEPQQTEVESVIAPLRKVTPLSKYLAMGLFVILPFLGGWIGYTLSVNNVTGIQADLAKNTFDTQSQNEQDITTDSPVADAERPFTDDGVGEVKVFVASTSQYVLKSYECKSLDPQLTALITCFSLEQSADGSIIHKNLVDVAVKQGIFSERDSRNLYSFEYISQAKNKIYFRTGIPESDACCGLVEYDIQSDTFVDKSEFNSLSQYEVDIGTGVVDDEFIAVAPDRYAIPAGYFFNYDTSANDLYSSRAKKISDNLYLVQVASPQQPAGPIGTVLFDELSNSVVRVVVFPLNTMDVWVNKHTRIVLEWDEDYRNRLTIYDYIAGTNEILYEEAEVGVQLAAVCEMTCTGVLRITEENKLVFNRYKTIAGTSATKLIEAMTLAIPEKYTSKQ